MYINREDRKFGWPNAIPNNGPFWTNQEDYYQFQQIMNYLNTVSDEEWKEICQYYAEKLMVFDPGNTRFINLLDQILNDSSKGIT